MIPDVSNNNTLEILLHELLRGVERLSSAIVETRGLSNPWLSMEEAEARTGIAAKTLFRYGTEGRLCIGGGGRARRVHRDHLDDQMARRFPVLPKGTCTDHISMADVATMARFNPAPEIAAPSGMHSRLRNTEELLAGCGVKKYQKQLQERGENNGNGSEKKGGRKRKQG